MSDRMDEDIFTNCHWDPCNLSWIFREDFNDMSNLWESECVSDHEMLSLVDTLDRYCPVVEDISIEDQALYDAVEQIEHEYVTKSEDMQYMRFDSEGNLFLYEPGAGMSGIPKRVIEFGSEEVIYADGHVQSKLDKFQTVDSTKVHRIAPRNGNAITKIADSQTRSCCTFNEPLDPISMDKLARKNFSEDTLKKVTWVRRMYSEWRIHHKSEATFQEFIECDLDYHETITQDNLVFGMCRFIREVCKMNGEKFPSKTLYKIVMCVQFHLESIGFMWKLLSHEEFVNLKVTLDNTMKERCSMNVGGVPKKADVLSQLNIDILWENNLLGFDNPEQLLHTVFFVIGMSCTLRAGREHHKLHRILFKSQFSWAIDTSGRHYLKYCEDITQKTNKGGLKHRKIVPKTVNVYPIEGSNRCPIAIINKYLEVIPDTHKCQSFYLQPKKKFQPNCWFFDRPVGKNRLQGMVCEVCNLAGIPGFYTNHSLRSTAATRLYHNDIDEQIIQEVTGHHSVAVREYKRTCDDQKLLASSCIMGSGVSNVVKKHKAFSK